MADNEISVLGIKIGLSDTTVTGVCKGFLTVCQGIGSGGLTLKNKWKDFKNQVDVDSKRAEANRKCLAREELNDEDKFWLGAGGTDEGLRKYFNKIGTLSIAHEQNDGFTDAEFEKVDEENPDFFAHFWSEAEKCTSDDMKIIWGKILAGELKEPNTYSLAMMQKIKSMTVPQMKIFERLIQSTGANSPCFANMSHHSILVGDISIHETDSVSKYFKIDFIGLKELESLGLINMGIQLSSKGRIVTQGFFIECDHTKPFELIKFTDIGHQLSKLVEYVPNKMNEEYIAEIKRYLERNNIRYGINEPPEDIENQSDKNDRY